LREQPEGNEAMRLAAAHGLGEIKGAIVGRAGEALEPASHQKAEALGEVISSEKLSALDMTRAELFELRDLLDEAVARHDRVGYAELLNRRNCHRLAQK
jgi:hypothetical protein